MINKIKSGTKQLIVEEKNSIITITLNNPKYKNALSEELTPYLREIIKKISKDSKYKLLIIKGKGNCFCSGGNIKKMSLSNKNRNITMQSKVRDLTKKQLGLTFLISSLKIPTIAVVTGAAAGAGFSLALSCDIRIGNKDAFFISNYSRIGLSGDYGISWYLTSLLGTSKAKEIMFLNNRIYAQEAYKIGLLNFLFISNIDKEVHKIAHNIILQPNSAIKLIKQNIYYAKDNTLKSTLALEAKNLIKSSQSKEHKAAVASFKKKKIKAL